MCQRSASRDSQAGRVVEALQDQGQAVVAELDGADGLADEGLEGVLELLGPGLDGGLAVVGPGEDVGDPDGDEPSVVNGPESLRS